MSQKLTNYSTNGHRVLAEEGYRKYHDSQVIADVLVHAADILHKDGWRRTLDEAEGKSMLQALKEAVDNVVPSSGVWIASRQTLLKYLKPAQDSLVDWNAKQVCGLDVECALLEAAEWWKRQA